MVYEPTRAQDFVQSTLTASTALCALVGGTASPRIYGRNAPQGAVTPYVLHDFLGGSDLVVLHSRAITTFLYAVQVVYDDATSNASLEAIADQVEATLENAQGTVRSMEIMQCQRTSTVADWGVESGQSRAHLGGVWKINVRYLA